MLLSTGKIRKKFRMLYMELSSLAVDIESLTNEITNNVQTKIGEDIKSEIQDNSDNVSGEIDKMCDKIRFMHRKLGEYITYVNMQAYNDTMTGVKSNTAYFERVALIKKKIESKTADFSLIVFDINRLKKVNDNYGHEFGDKIIKDAARLMKKVLGDDNFYRIGGDEFIALLENVSENEINEKLSLLDKNIELFNENEKNYGVDISVSKGYAVYSEGESYRAVFKRADEAMYADKAKYYNK